MKFTEKNDFIVKHKASKHFEKDLELFKKHCPNSRLHNDLKRVNTFTRYQLDGRMLYELIDKVSPEEILENRKQTEVEHIETVSLVEKIEDVAQLFAEAGLNPKDFPESVLNKYIGEPVAHVNIAIQTIKNFTEEDDNLDDDAPPATEEVPATETVVEETATTEEIPATETVAEETTTTEEAPATETVVEETATTEEAPATETVVEETATTEEAPAKKKGASKKSSQE